MTIIESCIEWENIFQNATAKPKRLDLEQNGTKQTMLHMFSSSYIRKNFEVKIYLNGKVWMGRQEMPTDISIEIPHFFPSLLNTKAFTF